MCRIHLASRAGVLHTSTVRPWVGWSRTMPFPIWWHTGSIEGAFFSLFANRLPLYIASESTSAERIWWAILELVAAATKRQTSFYLTLIFSASGWSDSSCAAWHNWEACGSKPPSCPVHWWCIAWKTTDGRCQKPPRCRSREKAVLQKNAKSRVLRRKAAKPPKKALQTLKKLSYKTIQNVL